MDTGKRLEIRHWAQKAIAFYEGLGKENTLALIANPKGPFIEGERYIFALDIEGKLLAHPFSKELPGRSLTDLRDSEGRSFIRKVLAKAKTGGYGFVEYMRPVPASEGELHKTVFFERVDGIVLCIGFYTAKHSFLEAASRGFGGYPCPPFLHL